MFFTNLKTHCVYLLRVFGYLPSLQRSLCLLLIYAHLYTTIGISAAVASGRVHSFKIEEMSPEEIGEHLKHSKLGVAGLDARDEPVRGLRLKLTEKPKQGLNAGEKQILFLQNLIINPDGTFVMNDIVSDLFKLRTSFNRDQANFIYEENGKTVFSLAIKPQGTTTLHKLKNTDYLKLKSCADIFLINQLKGQSLGLVAKNISNNAHLTLKGRLDFKALGAKGQRGKIFNDPEGIITSPRITVYEGFLKNQGRIKGNANLTVDLRGHSLFNDEVEGKGCRPKINAQQGLEIINGGKIVNNGKIAGRRALKITTNVLENNRTIKSPDLKINAYTYVHNKGFLGSDDLQSTLMINAFCPFINTGVLKAQVMQGYIRDLQNHGTITSSERLGLTLSKLLNYSNITAGQLLFLNTQSADVFNYGLISAGSGIYIKAFGGFQNHGTIKSTKGEVLFNETLRLHNHNEIRAKKLFILADEFENIGKSHGQDFLFVAVNRGNNQGLLSSDKEIKMGMRGAGHPFIASGAWTNTGTIKSPVMEAAFSHFANEGTIEGSVDLDIAVQEGTNTGNIISDKKLKLEIQKQFTNLKTIRSLIQAHVLLQGKLDNSGIIEAPHKLTFSGRGVTNNKGAVTSQKKIILNQGYFHNYGALMSGDILELALGKIFHNHLTGIVNAKGNTIITGNAQLTNDGISPIDPTHQEQSQIKPGITLEGDVTFADFRGTLLNQGNWLNQAKTEGSIAGFQNHHLFASLGNYDLTLGKFTNTAMLMGSGNLTLHEGENSGVIEGEELTLDISDILTHKEAGVLKTASLTLLGQGTFMTKGMIVAPKFRADIAGFINKGGLELQNPVFGGQLKSWRNEGIFNAHTLTFEKTDANACNDGTLEVTGALSSKLKAFINKDHMKSGRADLTGVLFKNTETGTLELAADSVWNITNFENDGDIISKGRIGGTVAQLTNRNLIQTRDQIDIAGTKLINDGKMVGDQGVKYNGQELITTARSEIITPRALTLTLATPLINLGLLKGNERTSLHMPAFINAGQCLSSTQTTLPSDFTNQGVADLRQINWISVDPYKTTLSNAFGAALTIRDTSDWNGLTILNNAGEMTLHNSPFVMDQVTNAGTLHLDKGAYHVQGIYTNSSQGRTVLKGSRTRLSAFKDTPCHMTLLNNEETLLSASTFNAGGLFESSKTLNLVFGDNFPAFHQIKAPGGIELIGAGSSTNVAAWLETLKGKLAYGNFLKVYTPEFKNSWALNFPTPLEINCLRFMNTDHLSAQGLTVKTQSFVNGVEGKLAHITSRSKLEIVSQQSINSRWGGLLGKRSTNLMSLKGNVRVGAFVKGGKFAKEKNGAFIKGKTLTVKAPQGKILFDYGDILAKKFINLEAKDLVRICASFMGGFGGGKITAKRFEVKRDEPLRYISSWSVTKRRYGSWRHRKTEYIATPNYAWKDTSDAAWVLIHGGELLLDIEEGYVLGSHIAADGWIRNHHNRVIYPHNNVLYALEEDLALNPTVSRDLARYQLANFPIVKSLAGADAWLKSRERVDFKDGNITISGNIQAPNITFNVTNILAQNTSLTRADPALRQTAIMNLAEALPLNLKDGIGLIEAQGAQAPYRYAFRGELEGDPTSVQPFLDPQKLMYMGAVPRNFRNVRFTLSPELAMMGLMATQGCKGLFNQPGWEGESGLRALAYRGQEAYGRNVATSEELRSNPLTTMLVGILNAKAKAVSGLAQKTQELRNAFMNDADEVDEISFGLVVPAKDQDPHANESGSIIGEATVDLHLQEDATFLSNTVAAKDVGILADRHLRFETKKYQTTSSNGNTVTTQEHACPPVQIIGENSTKANGEKSYAAIGLQAYSGKGGGTWGSSKGSVYSGPLNLRTTATTINKSRSSCGKKKIETKEDTSYRGMPTTYTSLGETTHLSGPTHLNHQVGVTNQSVEDINLNGGKFIGEAQILKGSTSSSKKGSVRNSSCSSESGHVTPNVMQTPKAVNINNSQQATFRGTRIQAGAINDNAPQTVFEEKKVELRHLARRSGLYGLGHAKTITAGGQETGAFSQIAANRLKSRSYNPQPSDQLTLQGVQARIDQAKVHKRFVEKAADLKSWQKTTGKTRGFSTPLQALCSGPKAFLEQDPLLQSITGFTGAKGGQDRIAAGIKLVTQILEDRKGLNPTSRYTSISLGGSNSRSSFTETHAYPNDLEIDELTVTSPLWDHGEGAKLKAIRVIAEVDEFLCSPAENSKSMEMCQKNASVSVNSLNWGSVSASVGKNRVHESYLIHDPAAIEADYFFLRTNNAKVSGATLRAKVFDAVVSGDLTLESVLDEIKKSRQDVSLSVSYNPVLGIPLADGRYAGEKAVEKWISTVCQIIGTQQFYFRVGETFLKRSAQAGLEAEGPEAEKLALMEGGEFYIRKVPGLDHACGFYAMELTRSWGTKLLLDHAHDEKLRKMVAVEIFNRALDGNLPASILNDARYQKHMTPYNAAFENQRSQTRQARLEERLLKYFQEQDVYERYIRYLGVSRGFDHPGEMLEFSPGIAGVHTPCVLDGLAYLQKRNLKIYEINDGGLGELVHKYVYEDDPQAETVHLYHTWYDEDEQEGLPNHFNRLERTAGRIDTEHTVEETLQETHEKRRTKLNVPLASAVALGIEIDKLLRPERYGTPLGGAGQEELEALEDQRQQIQEQVEGQVEADQELQDSITGSGMSGEEQQARLKEGREILREIATLDARIKGQGDAVLYDPETQTLRKVPVPLHKPQDKDRPSSYLSDDARRLEGRIRSFTLKNAAQDPFSLGYQPSLGLSDTLGEQLRKVPVAKTGDNITAALIGIGEKRQAVEGIYTDLTYKYPVLGDIAGIAGSAYSGIIQGLRASVYAGAAVAGGGVGTGLGPAGMIVGAGAGMGAVAATEEAMGRGIALAAEKGHQYCNENLSDPKQQQMCRAGADTLAQYGPLLLGRAKGVTRNAGKTPAAKTKSVAPRANATLTPTKKNMVTDTIGKNKPVPTPATKPALPSKPMASSLTKSKGQPAQLQLPKKPMTQSTVKPLLKPPATVRTAPAQAMKITTPTLREKTLKGNTAAAKPLAAAKSSAQTVQKVTPKNALTPLRMPNVERRRPTEISQYSTIFQSKLNENQHFPGKSDRIHFQEANKQLYEAMQQDFQFRNLLETRFPGLADSIKPSVNGVYPSRPPIEQGLTWHHNAYEKGLMELIPRNHHNAPGPVQKNLHPNQKGGMEIWGGGRSKKRD